MIRTAIAALWLLACTAVQAVGQTDFSALLDEAGLEFHAPEGFVALPLEADYVLPYEARFRSADGALEVRYAIRPLGRMEIDYEDPHNAAPAPNDLFNMLFRALSETLAADHRVISRTFPPEQAHEEFRAGWAAAGVFDLTEGISNRYREGMLLAIHQNDKADAYLLFLTNDLAAQKERIRQVRSSLRFRAFDTDIHRPSSSAMAQPGTDKGFSCCSNS